MLTALNIPFRAAGLPFGRLLSVLLGVALSLMVAASPVQARTRDQVMSRAFGCADIGDARLWLDCYYGAAQPLRAALGLQPASAAQIALAQSPPAGPAPQAADIRETALSGATRCGERDNDRKWLDCYYAAAQPMRAYLHLAPAPQSTPPLQNHGIAGTQSVSTSDQASNIQKDSFGLSNDTSRSKSITGRMTSYEFNKKGIFTVILSNGEIWRQLTGDTSFAHWNEQPQKYIVRIGRGLLGSYNFEVRDNPGMFKVHRIQ